jgi:hypothetical protein
MLRDVSVFTQRRCQSTPWFSQQEAFLMMTQETEFLKAHQQFQHLCDLMRQAGREGWRLDEIERRAMPKLMKLGLEFLAGHVESQGIGDVGSTVTIDNRTLRRSAEPHARRYLSIFGEMMIPRYIYALREGQKAEYAPLDACLGLPAGENSYVLEEWQQRLCVKDAFGQSVEDLKAILGQGVSVRTAEGMNRRMAEYAEAYRVAQPLPPAEEEAELLVVTGDGKGVVMRRPLAEELREETEATMATVPEPVAKFPRRRTRRTPQATRRARKARRRRAKEAVRKDRRRLPSAAVDADDAKKKRTGKKQMAYVGAVYTIERFPRTTDDVLDEMARRARTKERPRPQHKRVWAEMTRIVEGEPSSGREWLFCSLAVECQQRDPQRKKTLICLFDGERSLWDMQRFWFGRAIGILDIFHVSERIWGVAHCLHAKESDGARQFATHHLRMLLDGKVAYVLRNLRRLLDEDKVRGEKRKTVRAAITYFENNRDHMRYDEYLAAGYPIGSGVAEGACRHLVKDRLELTGMRWERAGAQAMLHLRAIYLNNEWGEFVNYRIENEQAALYGPGTAYQKLEDYAQAA